MRRLGTTRQRMNSDPRVEQASGTAHEILSVDLCAMTAKVWDASLQEAFSAKSLSFTITRARYNLFFCNEQLLGESVETLLKIAQTMATIGTNVTAFIWEDQEMCLLYILFQCTPIPRRLVLNFFEPFTFNDYNSIEELGTAIPLAAQAVRSIGGSVDFRATATGGLICLAMPSCSAEP